MQEGLRRFNKMRVIKNLNCVCCGYEPDEHYDGHIGDICPECNWEADYLDKEDNYWSGANGSFLDVWIEKYLSNKKKKEKLDRQAKAKQETIEFNKKVLGGE